MKKRIQLLIVVFGLFIVSRLLKYFFAYLVFGKEEWNNMSVDLANSYIVYTELLLIFICLYLYFKKNPLPFLGINNEWKEGLKYAILFSLPMLIGVGYLQNFNFSFSWVHLHRCIVLAGFYEEVFFRGLMFGLLFFYAGWGFIPAVIVPSIFFGLGHLYQAESINDAIGIFMFTFLANAGFAWFYFAWKNIWMVIFLHGFMDLIWEMFEVDTNVLGSFSINVFRFLTLGLAIYFSLRKLKKENVQLKAKLWRNIAQ